MHSIQQFFDSPRLNFLPLNLELESISDELSCLKSKFSFDFKLESRLDEEPIRILAEQLKDLIESHEDTDYNLAFLQKLQQFRGVICSFTQDSYSVTTNEVISPIVGQFVSHSSTVEMELNNLICSPTRKTVYAAVVLAKLTIELFLMDSPNPNIEMNSLHHTLCCFESSILPYTSWTLIRDETLEDKIKGIVHQLKDLIESHKLLSDVFFKKFKAQICSFIVTVEDEINSLRASSASSRAEEDPQPRIDSSGAVGLDAEIHHLECWLFGFEAERKILSIAGMAGIGKTTLVQQLFDDQSVVGDFDVRWMVRVGPKVIVSEILRTLLSCDDEDLEYLKSELYWKLCGRKYLVVLDDVWGNELWFSIGNYFPRQFNGSRVIITTRSFDVARCGGKAEVYKKRFLDNEYSWNLLYETVFSDTDESCSLELEKFGRKIARKCEGHPMAIVAVGKQLRILEKKVEIWEKVSEEENPLDIVQDEYLSEISKLLPLSYGMLPLHLKSCFLHIAVIPHKYEIFASRLIELWIAEGIIERKVGENRIEDTAARYLEGLVSESVVLVSKESSLSGGPKVCKIHVIFRNQSIEIAQKEKFCSVIKKCDDIFVRGEDQVERLCFHNNVVLGFKQVSNDMESIPYVRSLLCFGPHHQYPLRVYLNFGLLRVLDALRIHFYVFPRQVLNSICLRYLGIRFHGELPKCISKLRNLEVLIVERRYNIKSSNAPVYLPGEIWDLRCLRHLHCVGFDFQDPCTNEDCKLVNLLTLSGVSGRSCKSRILSRMPFLKKLGVRIELAPDEVETLSFFEDIFEQLHQLESFNCAVLGVDSQVVVPRLLHLPATLKKLTLMGCRFPWNYMTTIGRLRYLQVLKLRCYAFCGPVWKLDDYGFENLSVLLLEDMDFEKIIVNETVFPRLERLIIRHCYNFEKISDDFKMITTLATIDIEDCRPSIGDSALEITNLRREFGYRANIHSSWKDEKKHE